MKIVFHENCFPGKLFFTKIVKKNKITKIVSPSGGVNNRSLNNKPILLLIADITATF